MLIGGYIISKGIAVETWLKFSANKLDPMSFTCFSHHWRHWNRNKIIHNHRIIPGQNTRMYSDVLCLWQCKRYGHLCNSTIHVASRQAWRSPRSTIYMYISHVPYLIYISWTSGVLQNFRKAIVYLAWCLLPNQFHHSWWNWFGKRHHLLWHLKYSYTFPTLFPIVWVSTSLLSIRQFASSWNTCNAILNP